MHKDFEFIYSQRENTFCANAQNLKVHHNITSETLVDPSNAPNQISPKPTGVTEIER